MKNLMIRITLVFALLFGMTAMAAPQASSTGLIKCDVGYSRTADKAVAVRSLDPIVYHNQPSGAHQHDFFGNKLVPQMAPGGTWEKAVNGATTCRLQTDTAAYWAPSLVYTSGPKAGQRVPVRQFSAYYRGFAGQSKHVGSIAHPAGVRLVADDNKGYGLIGWTCGQNSTVTGGQDTIPNCSGEDGTAGNTLTAHANFPSCWNGKAPNHPGDPGRLGQADSEVGDTRDNVDWTYPTNKTSCPSTHPIEVVQLRETIQYEYTGNGTDVALTSDMNHSGVVVAPRGSTFHVDFWNTWKPGALEDFTKRCVNTAAEANCDL